MEGVGPEGNDELEYNEFFLRDNDFGSDIDSDGEEIMTNYMPNFARIKEETIGLRFIDHKQLASAQFANTTSPSTITTTNPLVLKGTMGGTIELSGYKYSSQSEDATATMTATAILQQMNDAEVMQLSNYYAVVYNPKLLHFANFAQSSAIAAEGENKKKSKKATTTKKHEEAATEATSASSTVSEVSPAAITNQNTTEAKVEGEKKKVNKRRTKKPVTTDAVAATTTITPNGAAAGAASAEAVEDATAKSEVKPKKKRVRKEKKDDEEKANPTADGSNAVEGDKPKPPPKKKQKSAPIPVLTAAVSNSTPAATPSSTTANDQQSSAQPVEITAVIANAGAIQSPAAAPKREKKKIAPVAVGLLDKMFKPASTPNVSQSPAQSSQSSSDLKSEVVQLDA